MEAGTEVVHAAHVASRELDAHRNSPTHIKARALALVAVVNACGGSQTVATRVMGYKDRQLIHRQVKRALERGWVVKETVDGVERLTPVPERYRQTELSEIAAMEHHPAGKPPILPPFSLPDPYAY